MTGFTDLDGTPIERAARRLNTLHHHLDMPRRRREARVAAEGLLDVEVMARVIDPAAFGPITRGSNPSRYVRAQQAATEKAAALRAALLGEGA